MSDQMFLEDFNFIERYDVLNEGKEGNRYILRGVFSRVDHPNKNKRIYPRDIMEESINAAKDSISNRALVGELDHPPTPKINVNGISHVINRLAISPDGAVLGEAEALDTAPGKTLKELMKARVKLGVSTRGVGSVEPYRGPLGEGLVVVKPGYRMKAIDIVFDPSQDAFPEYVREETEHKIILGATRKFSEVWDNVFGRK